MKFRPIFILHFALVIGQWSIAALIADPPLQPRQITSGPKHHFFGYIGHVRTIPWSGDGRWILALQTDYQDHMPGPDDPADVLLLDALNNYAPKIVDQTRAWNFQQGTMFYWNPDSDRTQFFFNDRDRATGRIFTVLYDLAAGKRIKEYRYDDASIGNSGVCQQGGSFMALNYGRLARLRPVTGYPGALDPTIAVKHPENDGIFRVDIASGRKQLILSYKQIADALRPLHPDIDARELFINHTLWNRQGDRLYFFARADYLNPDKNAQFNVPCVVNPDGSDLRPLGHYIGGHPDWDFQHKMIGMRGKELIYYDTDRMDYAGEIGKPGTFDNPGGDTALSPDGSWLVNGSSNKGKSGKGEGAQTHYVFFRRADGRTITTAQVQRGPYTSGDLRIDPAPCWNRDNTQIVIPALAQDGTRQMFLFTLPAK